MTAVTRRLVPDLGASDGMIASPDALINHLAQIARALGQSTASSHVAILGPFKVRVTLYGGSDATAIFAALPSSRPNAGSRAAVDAAQPVDFTIQVIDGMRCSAARPRLTWHVSDFGLKGRVPGWSNTERATYFLRGERGLAVADWRAHNAFVWLPSIEAMTPYERAAPFRWMIEGLARQRGLTTMHSAGIGERGIGVLIVGEGGRGKSTLALAAVAAGMDYIGDDYCLVDARPPYPAYRLFNTAKVRVDSEVALRWIAGVESEVELHGDKVVLNLARHAPERLVHQLEIRALLLPEFTDATRPVIEKASAMAAFRRAAPSTVAQCQNSEQQAVADIGRLVRMLPCYRIRMPREPRRSIERIRELVRTLQPPVEGIYL
jgi:hypothetical protein